MAVALLLVNREKDVLRNRVMPMFGLKEKMILALTGLLGGVLSALVGTGENSVGFMVKLLLFRVDEKTITPTTVVLGALICSLMTRHSIAVTSGSIEQIAAYFVLP